MSQNSVVLPTTGTVSGLQMTQATNNALDTLNSLASGASAPVSPQAGQLWHDTASNLLKIRSMDNTSWIPLFALNESAHVASPCLPVAHYGNVNRLINGEMRIDQVKEGGAYSIPSNNSYTYSADQWVAACNSSGASAVTAQRVSDAPAGFANSLKFTVGTGAGSVGAGEYLVFWQPVEANNISDLNLGTSSAGTVSLSFWVKASATGTYGIALQNASGTRSWVNKFTVTSGGSWQYVSFENIPCDSSGTWTNGNSDCLHLYFTVATGSTYQTASIGAWLSGAYFGSSTQSNAALTTSGATFQVTGVMLNAGAFALPYEHKSFQQELHACQRYFEKPFTSGTPVQLAIGTGAGDVFILSVNAAGSSNHVMWHFSARKRALPTLATYNIQTETALWRNTSASTDVGVGVLSPSEFYAGLFVTGTTSVTDNLRIHITANARM